VNFRAMTPSRRRVLGLIFTFAVPACKKPYRVGEHVWVEWEEGKLYPAYILERTGNARFRVHYDGYDPKWDEDVTLDRIRGRVEGDTTPLPPPEKVLRAAGKPLGSGTASQVAQYQLGDRVKVRWRGSTYSATVVEVVDRDHFQVHYDGHESAWDEVVHRDRIVGRR
jgi:hypothetical protein